MKKSLLFAVFIIAMSLVSAQNHTDLKKKQFNLDGSGLAIEGYDPVAYFTVQKAIEGKEGISFPYEGVTYHFSSPQNRDLFKTNPIKYMPQYGGWCAYAMGSSGEKVSIDPETFKLAGGKLYLFYNRFFTNTKKSWDKDETNLKNKADVNWSKFYK